MNHMKTFVIIHMVCINAAAILSFDEIVLSKDRKKNLRLVIVIIFGPYLVLIDKVVNLMFWLFLRD